MGRNTSGAHLVKFHAFATRPSSKKVFCRLLLVWTLIPLTDAPPVAEALLVDQATSDIAGLSSNPPDDHIYTWIGNTPEWNRKIHVSGYRMGCDAGDPRGCVREATEAVQQNGFRRVFLSMFVDERRAPRDAREYSLLSISHPFIAEIGFDDFVDRYEKLFSRPGLDPSSWLRGVIRSIKRHNVHLGFGITLYEDELDAPLLRSPHLPTDLARSVDYVHLFLHYRSDAPHFSEYIQRSRTLFPNAKIIAGLYAYDRVDYIQCSPSNERACTPREEIQLYKQAVTIVARMLKESRIEGIEFYPGFFGKENEWGGWKRRAYCSRRRVQECIADTRVMRQSTVEALVAAMDW
jgi:hypothetical protein